MIPYTSPDRSKFRRLHMTSLYVPMRDGVRLAVEIITPGPLEKNAKLPVLLHQTRYWRLPELRKPFAWMSDGLISHLGKMVREIVKSGYIFVNVDCRGSGASFGNQPFPWAPDEVQDGYEMIDWILKQPWCDGKIGSLGVSYTGTACEFLASTQHPALKAVMPLFSLYDVYDDIAVPGGVPHDGFVIEWGRSNAELDANRIPISDPMVKMLVKGVKPVQGKDGKVMLQEAIKDHEQNLHVNKTSEGVMFRDQAPSNGVIQTMDEFSPHTVTAKINQTQIAMYSGSGWMDGAYPHSSIRRFLNLKTPVNRLLLGPWDHGAKFHITPGKERKAGTDMGGEVIKFFDHYVKGYTTGIDKEPPVLYYTLQEEKWKRATHWPPAGTKSHRHFLLHGHHLSGQAPTEAKPSTQVTHVPALGTGEHTRWRGLLGRATSGHLYQDRKAKGKFMATFESPVLQQDVEVTGHPLVNLWVKTNEKDGALFAYLEDVNPGKDVWYVTEGHRRIVHRVHSTADQPYLDCVPNPVYNQGEAMEVQPGVPFNLQFDLIPTSYLFRKGHKIRISIAAGDKDNFKQLCSDKAVFEILHAPEMASWVELPVMG